MALKIDNFIIIGATAGIIILIILLLRREEKYSGYSRLISYRGYDLYQQNPAMHPSEQTQLMSGHPLVGSSVSARAIQTKGLPARLLSREPMRPRGFILLNTEDNNLYFSTGSKWDKILSTPNTKFEGVESGTYIPNILSISPATIVSVIHPTHYTRIGNIIQVTGSFVLSELSNEENYVELSLPLDSPLGFSPGMTDIKGTVSPSGYICAGSELTDRVKVNITSIDMTVSYHYAYPLKG